MDNETVVVTDDYSNVNRLWKNLDLKFLGRFMETCFSSVCVLEI